MPVMQIGFLDFTLFEDYPEFYATHKLMNEKNCHVYSDKLVLSVVDLSQIDKATKEDKQYRLDYWAALFKATTWEEIQMLASKDECIKEASKSIFTMTEDEVEQERAEKEKLLAWAREHGYER